MPDLQLIVDLRSSMPCWTAGKRELQVLASVDGWTVTLAADDADRAHLLTAGADAIWCWRLDTAEAATCPGLRWISTPAAGADYLPARDLLAQGLQVTVSHGHHGPAMAEHALGMLLALARGLPNQHAHLAAGGWRTDDLIAGTVDLFDGRLVIAGYGAIGREVARRAAAFGMDVIGLARIDRGTDDLGTRILGPTDHDTALAGATAVVNLLPHTRSTAAWFNASRLATLPDGCIFINLGRGVTVDEDALAMELLQGRLKAGLDVFATEPLSMDHPLRSAPGTLLTPHSSAVTRDYLLRGAATQVEQMVRYRDGEKLRWRVTEDLLLDGSIALD